MASSVSAIGSLTSIGAAPETDRYTLAAPKSQPAQQQAQQQQVNSTTSNDGVTLTLNARIHLLQQEGQTPTQISSSIPEPIATVDDYLQVPGTSATGTTVVATTANNTTASGTTTSTTASPATTAGFATAAIGSAGSTTASPVPAGAATASSNDAGTTDASSNSSASSSSASTSKYGASTSNGFGFPVAAKTDGSATLKAGAASGQTINLLT